VLRTITVTCNGDDIFPKNWNIKDSTDCEFDSNPPSGIFDVKIRIKIIDEKMYFNDNESHGSVFLCKQVNVSKCDEIVIFVRKGVRVFGTWGSTDSVENSRNLIERAEGVHENISWLMILPFIIVSVNLFRSVWSVRRNSPKLGNNNNLESRRLDENQTQSGNEIPSNTNDIDPELIGKGANAEEKKETSNTVLTALEEPPPLPSTGMPDGWSQDQWDYYGREWIKSQER
jgi:hypothetical protein